MMDSNLVGLRIKALDDVRKQFQTARNEGFAFIGIDLFPSLYSCPQSLHDVDEMLPLVGSDCVDPKKGDSIGGGIVGFTSKWIDCDSKDTMVSRISEYCLRKELSWAVHLALPAIEVPLQHVNNIKLARVLTAFIKSEIASIKIWISLPMYIEGDERQEASSPWHWWSQLVGLAGPAACESLGLLLEVPADLPKEDVVNRWLSEPVTCLALSTQLFLTNSKGFPILSHAHQHVLRQFLKINAQVLITGPSHHERGLSIYRQYINWIWKCTVEGKSLYEKYSLGFEDQLQEPLQPLQDNLSSATYGVFEMDPYKYKAYEEAICLALLHRCSSGKMIESYQSPFTEVGFKGDPGVKQIICVLGAGQGPFVDASLQASRRSGCPVRIYIIEKNSNALLTLRHRMQTDWSGEDVRLVPGDMRCLSAPPPEKADIFVSELLGSFGDNELSPECLDGAQHLLKDDGISIPASYTSYVAPLQSLRIYIETSRCMDNPKCQERIQKHSETPYVIRLSNCQILAAPEEAFTFKHPRKDIDTTPNTRYCCLTFVPREDGVIHGFAGYFEAVLYDKIMLSIHPQRHSPNMFSWFPMVFPLVSAVPVKAGQKVAFHLWRCISPRHVWYEWATTEPTVSKIHNSAGSAYKIGL
ncbi:protein arginine N methyltransferase 5 [Echinococcus multilocularis]|uniref:Protein arginine N-methyltransferase n=1 Tax=Echinococcus multilocularis TaxID=6211 RepID=A0A068YDH0_ECHMU|nr:protein arginine N methyltransferase 5 [Echinococcus multilocularis]